MVSGEYCPGGIVSIEYCPGGIVCGEQVNHVSGQAGIMEKQYN